MEKNLVLKYVSIHAHTLVVDRTQFFDFWFL